VTEASNEMVPRRVGRRAARTVLLSVVVLASAIGLWWASPRSSEIQLQPPPVCSYPRRGFDRVTIVTCGGPDEVIGLLNREQVLVPAGDRKPGGAIATITHASVLGRLRITKPWFGPYHYEFVAQDGTTTELTEVNRYIGAVEETI